MKRVVDVRIFGQSFTVASEDGDDHVRQVAAIVDDKMREVSAATGTVATTHVAILAALNLASEYQKLKEQHRQIQQSLARLSSRVEEGLEDDAD